MHKCDSFAAKALLGSIHSTKRNLKYVAATENYFTLLEMPIKNVGLKIKLF